MRRLGLARGRLFGPVADHRRPVGDRGHVRRPVRQPIKAGGIVSVTCGDVYGMDGPPAGCAEHRVVDAVRTDDGWARRESVENDGLDLGRRTRRIGAGEVGLYAIIDKGETPWRLTQRVK